MEFQKKFVQIKAHVMEKNSVSGAKQLALDTACQLHIIAKVTDVQKEESDRLKISWRRWGERECLTRMSSTNWFLS